MKALVRGNQSVSKAAIAAAIVLSSHSAAWAADSVSTTTADNAAATAVLTAPPAAGATPAKDAVGGREIVSELKPGLFLYKSGVIGMAPIPNSGKASGGGEISVADEVSTADEVKALLTGDTGARTAGDVSNKQVHCLATAIYFEARGESAKGQKAVAEVIMARTRTPGRPKSVCGVVYEGSHRKTGCQFSFTCDRAKDVVRNQGQWAVARRIARDVISGGASSLVKGATFYHADYVKPRWARHMVRVTQIGSHIFYKPKRGRLL